MFAPISVIITTYNDSDYLSKAIESVLAQEILPAQIVIVDDGSCSDDSFHISNKYMKNENNVRVEYFRKDNGGASSARNFGIKYVDQPYVTFLDADDTMMQGNLDSRYSVINNLSDDYFGVYGSGLTTKGIKYNFIDTDNVVCTSLVGRYQHGIPGGSCYYIFRSNSLREIGGFDESLSNNEDFDLIIRLLKNGKACKGSVGCVCLITVREDSLSRSLNFNRVFENSMKFLVKAEKENYFSCKELNKRKSEAYFFLARRVFLSKPIESLKLLNKAFSYSKPVGFKSKIIYFICLFANFILYPLASGDDDNV